MKSKTKILEAAIPLFASGGFNGISMRAIAREVGLNAASIYHHFPDKQTLYIKAMAHAFSGKAEILSAALATASHEQRLKCFVAAFCRIIHDDPNFRKLIQREILEGDESRLRLLAEEVFLDIFSALSSLSRELAPGYDAHLLAISIIGLMVYHYQTAPLRKFQPGSRPEHNDPDVLAAHVTKLLLEGIKGRVSETRKVN
ncbi:MAG: TetR/AcrR family transcriptional regulator [Thermodesulfobacteriota bacterium]|nr:TetR/AcrR family transcriptional regulator [Thermodesulfobacteriota bacterium]